MITVTTNYYKNQFGRETSANIHMTTNFWDPDDLVTVEENFSLQQEFTEKEIKDAIFSSNVNGAPSPDGFSFLFYQTFWDVIKQDFMALVHDFCCGNLDLSRLNFYIVTLLPKEPYAT